MKTCWDCGAEVAVGAAFCGNCGRRVGPKTEKASPQGAARRFKQDRKERDEALRRQSEAELTALRQRIVEAARAYNRSLRPRMALLGLVAFGGFLATGEWANGWVLLPGALLMGHLFAVLQNTGARWLTPAEYYSIAGSRNQNGEHRCIGCGHPGIYRKGQYRSNATYAGCSKCGQPFFAE